MKKRIISLILVLVIAAMSLVSCAYSFAKDDMAKYGTFEQKNFEAALKTIVIEDGDFTTDTETRNKKLEDKLYSLLYSAVKSDAETLTAGTPGGHDYVSYCYYVTMENDKGETVYLFSTKMQSTAATGLQLGMLDTKTLAESLTEKFTAYEFKDSVYESIKTGNAEAGDVVYVDYTYTMVEELKNEDGTPKLDDEGKPMTGTSKPITVKNERLVLDAEGTNFLQKHLIGKKVATTIKDFKSEDEIYTYSTCKINWIAKGAEAFTVTDVTYSTDDDEVKEKDTNQKEHVLNGEKLTYHIFPVSFVSVPEYTAENIINYVLGSSITAATMETILFGKDFADKTDEEKETLLKDYVAKDGDLDVELKALVDRIDKAATDYKSAKDSLKKAKEDLKKAEEKYDAAEEAVKTAGDKATAAQKDKVTSTKKEFDAAKTLVEDNEKKVKEKLEKRDAEVKLLFAISDDIDEKIIKGHREMTFNSLLDAYNNTIKMNLAKEVWFFIEKYVSVTSTPKAAVDAAYDQLIQNYQDDFYNGEAENDKSNYVAYNQSFEQYLIATVKKDLGVTAANEKEARDAIRKNAEEEYVKPIVKIYTVAAAYGLTMTDKEFDEYKKDTDNNYSYNEYSYGETSVIHAFQFDKVMNYLLGAEEQEDGSYKYEGKIENSFTFGTPISETEADKKEDKK